MKNYGSDLDAGWTIAPDSGDCNDYAVTKRHDLLENGLPSAALRLSVIRTTSGVGHLVLVVITTKGDVVMDNLTDAIRPWQITEYEWRKNTVGDRPSFLVSVKPPARGPLLSRGRPRSTGYAADSLALFRGVKRLDICQFVSSVQAFVRMWAPSR